MKSPVPPTIEPLLDTLADRIARRDLPPVIIYTDPFAPAQVRQRLAHQLVPLTPRRNDQGRVGLARMLYQFLEHETRTGAHLAEAAGVARVAGSRAHSALVEAGLLRWTRIGPRRVFRLSRWGEDWLLAVGRNEVPPARPGDPPINL